MKKVGLTGATVEPCVLTILPEYILKEANPVIVGVFVEGNLEVGTPLCLPSKKFLELGRVSAIRVVGQADPTPVTTANHGSTVIVKVDRPAISIILGRLNCPKQLLPNPKVQG